MSMIRRTTSAKNLMKAIKEKLVTVTEANIQDKEKGQFHNITPESFVSDLEFYCESGIFAETIDIKYGQTEDDSFLIFAGNTNPFCDYGITVKINVTDGVSCLDVENILNENMFTQKSDYI